MAESQTLASSELSIGRKNRSLWYRPEQEERLGCCICSDHRLCGGLRLDSDLFDCVMVCDCANASTCSLVCPKNPEAFVGRIREINGFGFQDITLSRAVGCPDLPSCVPLVYHRSRRTDSLDTDAIAVPLSRLFHGRSGLPHFTSKPALEKALGFSANARLVITGVDHDQPLENYWANARRASFVETLRSLNPSLVTTPNFSLFTDVPRWDNLYNMKRIAICWYELAECGCPTALHVNARTDRDWERWKEFLQAHREIAAVAFEFKTGGASVERGRWHARKLAQLAMNLDRPMQLVVRGGLAYLPELREAFSKTVFVTADPFLKATKRRKLVWTLGAKPKWVRVLTLDGQPLDELLQHNVDTYRAMMTASGIIMKGLP